MEIGAILVLFIFILSIVVAIYSKKKSEEYKKTMEEMRKRTEEIEKWKSDMNNRFDGIIDMEEERKRILNTISDLKNRVKEEEQNKYLLKKEQGELQKSIDLLADENNLLDFGYYEYKYNFERSELYNIQLEKVKEKLKNMIKDKTAATCATNWEVQGSKSKGKTLTNNILKLGLRAFNGESDAAIAKVKYNNIKVMEARIMKSHESINKMLSYFHCEISYSYMRLKLEELYLTHEYLNKVEEEKEEQRRIKEQMREEEKAQREFERAQLEAQKDEERAQKALEKAEEKLKNAHGAELAKLNEQIAKLKESLDEAKRNMERAKSMAQMTKSGYVYVISNVGSFGDDVYKIGMTRRLEPMDRVRELGNASVPFNFDVHAMIYAENAPELENTLHKEFYNNRVNKVNDKREFFKIDLNKIKEAAQKHKADVKFTMIAEAEQYRRTVAMEKEMGLKQ